MEFALHMRNRKNGKERIKKIIAENINSLNGYERGVVLNDCYAYFIGGKYHSGNAKNPCGVVAIVEEEIK